MENAEKLNKALNIYELSTEVDHLSTVNAKLVEALEDVIPELKGLVVDSGGCDHSAGICYCELIEKINRATEVLKLAKGE